MFSKFLKMGSADDRLGAAFRDIKGIKLYPSIGMKKPGVHIKVNFGQDPFMFDIDEAMRVSWKAQCFAHC